jgi:hypothetical protein
MIKRSQNSSVAGEEQKVQTTETTTEKQISDLEANESSLDKQIAIARPEQVTTLQAHWRRDRCRTCPLLSYGVGREWNRTDSDLNSNRSVQQNSYAQYLNPSSFVVRRVAPMAICAAIRSSDPASETWICR